MRQVLILTSKNSARSQMLEGWLRYYSRGEFDVSSAGLEEAELDAFAVKAMIEAVVDIRKAKCKVLDREKNGEFDYVITLTPEATLVAHRLFGDSEIIEKLFDDPKIASGDDKTRLKIYRKTVDEIDDFAMELAFGKLGVDI